MSDRLQQLRAENTALLTQLDEMDAELDQAALSLALFKRIGLTNPQADETIVRCRKRNADLREQVLNQIKDLDTLAALKRRGGLEHGGEG